MEEPAMETESSGTPSTIERSSLDFANENPSQQITSDDGTEDQVQGIVASEVPPPENVTTAGVTPKIDLGEESTAGGKSLSSVGLETRSTFPVPAPQEILADASDPDPLSYVTRKHIPAMVGRDQQLLPGHPRNMPGPGVPLSTAREAKLLKKSVTQVARRDKRIQARENKIKNIEALLEAEADMKKSTEAKNAELVKELESLRAQVEKSCAEIDACLDALSIDFDEELYPHMLTAIAGRRWVIGYGLRLAVMKCVESAELRQAFADMVSAGITKGMSEGLKHGVEHGKASLDLEVIEAYDLEVNTKYVADLRALRDLKYPMVDQLESLKDAPIDVIMESLHLENDSGEDAPQWIRELRPSSSQTKIHVYPEVRDPKNPWS
ncbi:hypothetical protein Tco_1239848, partial [Tanacetum coccineum]